MSLIVETGAGLSNAESYISVANADIYNTAYVGNALWANTATTTAMKEVALRVATQYIDAKYSFKGYKSIQGQALAWPRADAYDDSDYLLSSTSIPECLKRAVVEAAIRHIAGDLLLGVQDKPGAIASESIKVGPIEKSVSYVAGRSQAKAYPKITGLLKSITSSLEEMKRS